MRPLPAGFWTLAACLGLLGASTPVFSQTAPPPTDGSVQLAWNSCYFDGGTSNRTFACDTNAGSATLVVTVISPVDIPSLNGFTLGIEVLTLDPLLPDWWQFQLGGCRPSALTIGLTPPSSASACADTWNGAAMGGTGFMHPGFWGSSSGRIGVVAAIPGTTSIAAHENYFLARITIPFAASTGTGTCGGCASGACLGLWRVLLTQPAGIGDVSVIIPLGGTNSDLVTWQPGVVMRRGWDYDPGSGYYKLFTCLSETEVRRPTWGAIKRMYRR